jgi:inosine-uridine nucleoside N-ribohydrolase
MAGPQKVVFFLDVDKDDYYSLCLIAAQHYWKVIDVIGVVVDVGFLPNIQDGLLLTKQWLNKIQVATNLDDQDYGFPIKFNLYAGLERADFLKKRLFPNIWTTSFVSAMKDTYNITLPNYNYETNTFTEPYPETGAPSVDELFYKIVSSDDKIKCLSTGPPTSLATGLDRFPLLSSKISSIYSMCSNYLVPGNVPEESSQYAGLNLPTPYLDHSGEYNAFMNPYALQRICLSSKNGVDVNIVPLDATNYARLVPQTVKDFEKAAAIFIDIYTNYYPNPWVVNLCNYFISLVATTLVTENSTLYLWDLCATTIALGANIDQFYILGTPIISVSGKIQLYSYSEHDKDKIYMSLNYHKLIDKSIKIIFNDKDYLN